MRPPGKSLFMTLDVLQADTLQVIDGCTQADGWHNRRRSGLKPVGQVRRFKVTFRLA
jgi:hypothetical protein